MKAIVTGGAGFIGSHLMDELINRNVDVTVWDNLFRGKLENINHNLDNNNSFLNIDLSDINNIEKMAENILKEQPNMIFHYAAINGTQYFYDIPAKVLEVNSSATYNLMLALRKVKEVQPNFKCKIIYASSSEVYGEPFKLPSNEKDVTYVNIDSIRDSYAASKLIGEFYVKLIAEELSLEYNILRLFNVYGNRMIGTKYGQVIPEFINRLSEGEYPLNIFGDGSHMRSFCFVKDNVNLTIDLALSNCDNGVYNVGNNKEISILELAEMIMKKMDKEPKFVFLEERSGDHKRRCPDLGKLFKFVDKQEFIELENGIELMLK